MNDSTTFGATPQTFLHRFSTSGKLIGCLVFILCVVAQSRLSWQRLTAFGAVVLLLWLSARMPFTLLLSRLGLALPFVLLATVSLPFLRTGGPLVWQLPWGLAIHQQGLALFELTLLKAILAILALSLLGATCSMREFLATLQALHTPRLLLATGALTARYLVLLQSEARRLMQARDARGTIVQLGRRMRVAGMLVGVLFLRSYERAERVGQAMILRGFDGSLPLLVESRMPLPEFASTLVFCVAVLTLALVQI